MHEAAHCVASVVVGLPVYSIEVDDSGSGAFRHQKPYQVRTDSEEDQSFARLVSDWKQLGGPQNTNWMQQTLAVSFAGPAADMRTSGNLDACSTDFQHITGIIEMLPTQAERDKIFSDCLHRAKTIVADFWWSIERLADGLHDAGRLYAGEIMKVVGHLVSEPSQTSGLELSRPPVGVVRTRAKYGLGVERELDITYGVGIARDVRFRG